MIKTIYVCDCCGKEETRQEFIREPEYGKILCTECCRLYSMMCGRQKKERENFFKFYNKEKETKEKNGK